MASICIDLIHFVQLKKRTGQSKQINTNQYRTEKNIRKDLFGTEFQSHTARPLIHSLAAHRTPPWPIAASTMAAAPALPPSPRLSAAQQQDLINLRRLHALRFGAISNFSCLLHLNSTTRHLSVPATAPSAASAMAHATNALTLPRRLMRVRTASRAWYATPGTPDCMARTSKKEEQRTRRAATFNVFGPR